MGFYLSVGAECQDTDTQEPSGDTSTFTEGIDLRAAISDVICVNGSVAGAGFDVGADGATSHTLLSSSSLRKLNMSSNSPG